MDVQCSQLLQCNTCQAGNSGGCLEVPCIMIFCETIIWNPAANQAQSQGPTLGASPVKSVMNVSREFHPNTRLHLVPHQLIMSFWHDELITISSASVPGCGKPEQQHCKCILRETRRTFPARMGPWRAVLGVVPPRPRRLRSGGPRTGTTTLCPGGGHPACLRLLLCDVCTHVA